MTDLAPYLWLLPSLKVTSNGDELIIIDASGEVAQLRDPSTVALGLVEQLNGESSTLTLTDNPYYPVLVPFLKQKGWLVTLCRPLSSLLHKYPALSREISAFAHLYPDKLDSHFETLARKRVVIVGLGGIGSNLAFALCANGVGSLTVVDLDIIESTNLNRQFLYTMSDIGKPKVEILARELAGRFSQTAVRPIHDDFDRAGLAARLIDEADLLVLCGESSILNDQPSLCQDTPLMVSGYQGAVGVIGPLVDSNRGTACWKCMMDYHGRAAMRVIESSSRSRQSSWNPSGFSINSLTGSMCSNICISVLSEQPSASQWLGVRLRISMTDLSIEKARVEPFTCVHSRSIGTSC